MIRPYTIDKPLAALVAKLPAKVSPFMVFASFIAAPPAIAAILFAVVGIAAVSGNTQLLSSVLLLLLFSPLAEISKFITRRHRPETLYVERMRFKTYSFPSGHSYISALVFGFFAILTSAWGPYGWLISLLLICSILIVGISRIYLGAHFPSDVIAGWIFGGTMQFVAHGVGWYLL